jgi:hypothetical protein
MLRKLSVVAAVLSPLAMIGVAAAPASAAGGTVCTGNSGSMTLSPGLETNAAVQNIVIKGILSGCSGSTVTSATYVAHLKTTNPADCATLLTAGEPASGSIVIKWAPKGQGNSHGTIELPLTGSPGATMSGKLESGPFEGAGIFGTTITPTFGTCGAKKLKKATFVGSTFRATGSPKASITSPATGGKYTQNAVVATAFACTESVFGPGLQSCVDSNGSSSGTGSLETATAGEHTYSVTAISLDGLKGKATIKYTVEP